MSIICLAKEDATFFNDPSVAVAAAAAVVEEERITAIVVVVVVIAEPLFSFPAPTGRSGLNNRDRLFAEGSADVAMYSTSETGDDDDGGGDLNLAIAVLITAAEEVVVTAR